MPLWQHYPKQDTRRIETMHLNESARMPLSEKTKCKLQKSYSRSGTSLRTQRVFKEQMFFIWMRSFDLDQMVRRSSRGADVDQAKRNVLWLLTSLSKLERSRIFYVCFARNDEKKEMAAVLSSNVCLKCLCKWMQTRLNFSKNEYRCQDHLWNIASSLSPLRMCLVTYCVLPFLLLYQRCLLTEHLFLKIENH